MKKAIIVLSLVKRRISVILRLDRRIQSFSWIARSSRAMTNSVALLMFPAATLTILCFFMWATDSRAVDTGDSAPDFQVVTIDGKNISYYKDVKGKKPLYLIFWSTW
jgi:hypothetical protein